MNKIKLFIIFFVLSFELAASVFPPAVITLLELEGSEQVYDASSCDSRLLKEVRGRLSIGTLSNIKYFKNYDVAVSFLPKKDKQEVIFDLIESLSANGSALVIFKLDDTAEIAELKTLIKELGCVIKHTEVRRRLSEKGTTRYLLIYFKSLQ